MERLLPGGMALVKTPQISCLVAGALPGELVRLRPTGCRHGITHAELTAIVKPSRERIEPVCPVAHECGGCALQNLHADAHAALKSGWVRRAFAPHITPRTAWRALSGPAQSGRRRCVRLWRGEDDQGSFLGFYAGASHRVVRHGQCMQMLPRLNTLRQRLEPAVPDGVQSVQLTALHDGTHVVFESDRAPPDSMQQQAGSDVQLWWRSGGRTLPLNRPVRRLHDRVPAGQGWLELEVGPDDFIQGQADGNADLVRQVKSWAGGARRIVDLFAGIGNLSLSLASEGAEVVGAEIRPASVAAANRNASQLGVNAVYHVADLLGSFDPAPFIAADVLIVDPPRKGAKRVCKNLNVLLPESIMMLHCDVDAGARDANVIASFGYRLHALSAFDLFPYTGHVEAMSLWRR